jgi:methyltransferase
MIFAIFICFIILQRLFELIIAKRNEKWARSRGAVEFGQNHYPYIIVLHTAFIISVITEYFYKGGDLNYTFLFIFFVLILFKVWVIASLGNYWNTKILRIPGSAFIKKGPYKLIKHPNYFIVVCEIIIIPMVFNLFITAIVFSILNAIMLTVRISEEDKVWAAE